MSHTRTHVFVEFANPYQQCQACRRWATGWHDPDQCGCREEGWWNVPCGCRNAEIASLCWSWGPVDGCTCGGPSGLGAHPRPPAYLRGDKKL